MEIKKRIIVKGYVQAVGYRALIKQIARNNGIKGSVKNLDDGTVEIYCACDHEIYENFKKKINIKASDTEDPLQINLIEFEVYNEESENFDSTKIESPFEILYNGEEMTKFESESLERSEMAILAMTSMNKDMNTRFDSLTERYDKFGQSMEKLEKDIHEMKDAFLKLTNHFVNENK